MAKLYTEGVNTIEGHEITVEYVDGFQSGDFGIYIINAWANKGTELEVEIVYNYPDIYLAEEVDKWLEAVDTGEDF